MRIAVTNLKGGVGKTTITTNLAVEFVHNGQKVCIVDTDLGQKSAMEWSGSRSEHAPHIPVFGAISKQLNKEIAKLNEEFDVVMIDGTPQLSELAERTVLASDLLIIPISPSIYDLRAFESFYEKVEQINSVREDQDLRRVSVFVIINRISEKTNLGKEIIEALSDYTEVKVFQTKLANRIAYAESATQGSGVYEWKDAKAKAEFNQLAQEVFKEVANYSKSL
jgi:chromosome partitioning protein